MQENIRFGNTSLEIVIHVIKVTKKFLAGYVNLINVTNLLKNLVNNIPDLLSPPTCTAGSTTGPWRAASLGSHALLRGEGQPVSGVLNPCTSSPARGGRSGRSCVRGVR